VRTIAVVVNWNGGAENLRCLESLAEQGAALEGVIFVDNASSDGSCEAVERRFPAVEVLRNAQNLGYGGGNNRGIARALERGAEAVLVVNNDLTFEPGCLAALQRALASDPTLGVVGPRVLTRGSPTIWAAGGVLTWRQNLTTLRGFGERDGPEFRRELDVDYLPGCALLVRREVFEKVGVFDDAYFAYTEDVDFGLRASRAGLRSRCIGGVAAYHAPSTSTGGGYNPRRKYMMAVNSIWFLRRYAGTREWLRFLLYDVCTLPFVLVDGLCRGYGKAALAKALGLLDGLRGKRITGAVVQPGAHWLW
jgi:GT2 family glycosyltransferase